MKGTHSTITRALVITTFLSKRCGRLLLLSLMFLCCSEAQARSKAADRVDTGNAELDSLLVRLNKNSQWITNQGVGKMDVYTDIKGYSCSQNHRWWTPFVQDLLPYEYKNDTTFFSATCKASYQTPCDLHITPLSITSNNRRRCHRLLKQLYPILLPVYAIRIMRDKGDNKDYILPFSNDGLKHYNFSVADTLITGTDTLVNIQFSPRQQHHDLLQGTAQISLRTLSPMLLCVQGRIDFGLATDTIQFEVIDGVSRMKHCIVDLYYQNGKMSGHNHYEYDVNIAQLLPAVAFDRHLESLDLTEIYQTQQRPRLTEPKPDSVRIAVDTLNVRKKRRGSFFKQLPQTMVSTTDIDAFGTDIRIYGPLNPATIGYDKINGLTLRERVRLSHIFAGSGQSLRITPEVGYAYRLKEFRYNFSTEWTYCPQRRGALLLRLQNGTNGFSSRFKDDVNNIINRYREQLGMDYAQFHINRLDFDSLGLRFFNRYEFTLENAIELSSGLMFHFGSTYSIRRPVKHGVHAQIQTVTDATIDRRYLDMNPYLRLVWTPRQYYYYEGKRKIYLRSQWPTFCFEVGKGVKNILKSRANYCRLEFDAHQHLRIDQYRNLSWHFGGGGFFKQDEEYFVNYTYFSRSKYPSTWDRRASGGTFALLDEYWFSSSPSYLQSHVMFESPFLLMHKWKHISKYIIKERIYCSTLIAQSKNPYGEIGYGIGNNYFNVSLFCGILGHKPFDFGAKFSIELDQHL